MMPNVKKLFRNRAPAFRADFRAIAAVAREIPPFPSVFVPLLEGWRRSLII